MNRAQPRIFALPLGWGIARRSHETRIGPIMRISLSLLIPLALLASSCSESSESNAIQASDPVVVDTGGVEPVSNWKSERKRIAMLGLNYDSGMAVPVPSEVEEVLSGLSTDDLPRLQAEGREQMAGNRALEAIATYTRVVLLTEGVAEHYLDLGYSLLAFKLDDQGEAAYRTGLDLDPDNAELVYHVGDWDWRRGNFDEAVTRWERVLELDTEHGATWGRLARAHFYAERDMQAWDAFHRAEDLGEEMPPQMRDLLAARTPEPVR